MRRFVLFVANVSLVPGLDFGVLCEEEFVDVDYERF